MAECWIEGILTAVAYYDSEINFFYLDFWIRNHSRFTHLLLPMRSTDPVSRSASWSGGSAFLIIHTSCWRRLPRGSGVVSLTVLS